VSTQNYDGALPVKSPHAIDWDAALTHPATPEGVQAFVPFPAKQVQMVERSLAVLQCLEHEIRTIENTVLEAGRAQPGYALLQTVPGIGPILAGTILLETGGMRWLATVGVEKTVSGSNVST
jgi:transposase